MSRYFGAQGEGPSARVTDDVYEAMRAMSDDGHECEHLTLIARDDGSYECVTCSLVFDVTARNDGSVP